ncbi:hypothetical protein J7E73_12485 [Paenibacillus albidus]|uniref:hypothetical protein n=1 Tax=Paenibacillus albidus TaxID=2041023 RepID=UPI001BE99FED|nr:hypothetical protein [Paenibacillus albidus]MBT2289946.1 hypothetical protein [Paenibacillus albidus]
MKFKNIAVVLTCLMFLALGPYGTAGSAAEQQTAVSTSADIQQSQKNLAEQLKALKSQFRKPGEILYIFVNDKKLNPGGLRVDFSASQQMFKNYSEYLKKAKALKTPFLQLTSAPKGYTFAFANISSFMPEGWSDEYVKLSESLKAQSQSSGKDILTKLVLEKRSRVNLSYAKNNSYLLMSAAPAGTLSPKVSFPAPAVAPEMVTIYSQKLTYTTGKALPQPNDLNTKWLEWIDSRTHVSYKLTVDKAMTKEALLAVAKDIITGQ